MAKKILKRSRKPYRPVFNRLSRRFLDQHIKNKPLLTAQEEVLLGETIQSSSGTIRQRAINKLVEANYRLVISIALSYLPYGMTYEDMIQEGNIGLIQAAEIFNPKRGCRFSTLATLWITQTITRALYEKSRVIHLPTYFCNDLVKIKKAQRKLENCFNRDPTVAEIAQELGYEMDVIKDRLTHEVSIVSLSTPLYDGTTMLEEIVSIDDPNGLLESWLEKQVLSDLIDQLPKIEKQVIRLRIGLDNNGGHRTLQEVGEILCYSRERVRQLEVSAIEKLQKMWKNIEFREKLREDRSFKKT